VFTSSATGELGTCIRSSQLLAPIVDIDGAEAADLITSWTSIPVGAGTTVSVCAALPVALVELSVMTDSFLRPLHISRGLLQC
jgi:hypothetical protein